MLPVKLVNVHCNLLHRAAQSLSEEAVVTLTALTLWSLLPPAAVKRASRNTIVRPKLYSTTSFWVYETPNFRFTHVREATSSPLILRPSTEHTHLSEKRVMSNERSFYVTKYGIGNLLLNFDIQISRSITQGRFWDFAQHACILCFYVLCLPSPFMRSERVVSCLVLVLLRLPSFTSPSSILAAIFPLSYFDQYRSWNTAYS